MNSNHKKSSRRKFLSKSILLTGLPMVFYSLPFAAGAKDAGKNSGVQDHEGPDDLVKLDNLLKQKEPMIWVFTGDSITLGAKHTHGYHCYPEVFQERIRWEISRYRDVVINTGISGHTTKDILSDFDWRITQFRPSVVSLMIGTNDCKNSKWGISLDEFEKNLRQLLTKIRELNAIPVLQTPPIVIKEKSHERVNLPQYVAVIRKIAEEQNIVLVDHYAHWTDTLENHPEVNVYKNWFNDPNHPGAVGHAEIARLMFQKLSIFNPADPTCGGVYYEGDH